MNKCTLLGHIGADPILKDVGQSQVVEFSLATSRRVKKNDAYENVTTWHNIKAWGKTAENISKHFSKGSRIIVEGRIEQRSWKDKDNVTRYVTEIIVESYYFIDKPKQSGGQSDSAQTVDVSTGDNEQDDLPF